MRRSQRTPNRRPNISIPRASTDVSAEILADLSRVWMYGPFDHAVHSHQPSRRAVSALQSMMLLEELLHGVQSLGSVQSFESENFRTLGLYRQQSTRARWLAIDHDGTGAASAFSASDLQCRQAEMVTQEITQQKTVGYQGLYLLSVYDDTQCRS